MQLAYALLASSLVATAAYAQRPPSGPDFLDTLPARGIDQRISTSSATDDVAPINIIPFGFDSHRLSTADRVQLRQAARWLLDHPDYSLVLAAHTDAHGTEAYNLGLAARRALAVQRTLTALGVERSRIAFALHGEASPRARNAYAASNRAVVVYPAREEPAAVAHRAVRSRAGRS